MEINSLTNNKVKQWSKYKEKKYREQDKRFLIEGEHLIEEAHRANLIECILIEREHTSPLPQYETYEVTLDILKKLSDSVSGTWIMAVCHYPIYSNKTLGNRIILLDGVQDPGNVGTIIRSAVSFGFDSVVLSKQCADIYNEKVIRSTQGALFHIPTFRTSLEELVPQIQKEGIQVYATSLHEAIPMRQVEITKKIALVFGNEGKGVNDALLALADERVYIEMNTFESLNVAVAAGICMYYFNSYN